MCKTRKPTLPETSSGPSAATAKRPDRSWLINEARARIQRSGGAGRRTVATALAGVPDDPALASRQLAGMGSNRNPRTPTILGR